MISTFTNNKDVLKAKGDIPYWKIAKKLFVHEQTLRYWMRKEMDPERKQMVLAAIDEVKQDLIRDLGA